MTDISARYIPAFSIEDVILDKDTGYPLSGGLVYFEQDNNRGTLKPVYQLTGTSPNYTVTQLPNPMTLSSIGTFVDSLGNPVIPYFLPFVADTDVPEYYFVRVTSSTGVPQFTRERVPYISTQLNPSSNAVSYTNELSNPQFAQVLFDTTAATFTYNYSGAVLVETPIAPGWDLVVSGTGSVTVSQVKPTGTANTPTNPGTLLNIVSAGGITVLQLRQRLYGSPNLFSSENVSVTLLASAGGGSPVLNMFYKSSNGMTSGFNIFSKTLTTANTVYYSSAAIPVSASVNTYPGAYVDIYMDIPLTTSITLSSIQLVATGTNTVATVPYDQTTNAQQINNLFWYYKPQLEYKPIPSYLVGWDFRLNPCQVLGTTVGTVVLGGNKSRYIADQTIAFEGGDNVTSYAFTQSNGLTITTSSAADNAIIQYLPASLAREILNQNVSVQLKGNVSGTTITGTVSLWWTTDATLPNVKSGTNNSLVASVAVGIPTVGGGGIHGTWTQLAQVGNGTTTAPTGRYAPFTLTTTSTAINLNSFQSINLAGVSNATFFAIVVAFAPITAAQTVTLEYVSLVGGDIATRPAAQSPDEVYRQCQFYYEKSYSMQIKPGSVDYSGALYFDQLIDPAPSSGAVPANLTMRSRVFELKFQQVKFTSAPLITIYDPSNLNASGFVLVRIYNNNVDLSDLPVSITNWIQQAVGSYGVSYLPANVNVLSSFAMGGAPTSWQEAMIIFQYTADCRLGTF
jgi:hypothetical protein